MNRIKSRVKASHPEYTDEQIETAFGHFEAESDRPFIDWLANGGFEKILAAILQILALLG